MRCINCFVDTQRLRRHIASSLPIAILTILAGWLTVDVPMDTNICHPCYELLHSDRAGEVRLFGHSMLCVACGHSVRSGQRHVLDRDHLMVLNLPRIHPAFLQVTNYACHRCWTRHQRQLNRDLNRHPAPEPRPEPAPEPRPEPAPEQRPEPAPEQRPEPAPEQRPEPAPGPRREPALEPEINLTNYKRTANTSTHCVFYGCIFEQHLHVVPAFIKKMIIQKYNLYITRSARVCETHLLLDVWHILQQNPNTFMNFTAAQIEDMINITSEKAIFNFENVHEMSNTVCQYWTGLTISNFLNLFSVLPQLSFKKPKNALAIYLAKLRTGETDRRLATIFGISCPTLSAVLKKIRQCLTTHLVPYFLGPQHLTHNDIVNRNLSIPNALFGNINRPAIAIFDGTYVFLQKSSNYLFQKKTYSLHKYDNLVKPFMIVSSDGHIIDVVGPFAATQTDAEIMMSLFQAEDSPYRQLFQNNDVFILDRGFRDSLPLLRDLGFQVFKPESLNPGQRQLTTEQANKSRKVTLCRWVVEVVNGRFKRDYKLFRQRFFNIASTHLMEDFRIAAALINKFHRVIEDSPNANQIIERVGRFMQQPNLLGTFVNQNNMNRQIRIFNRINGNLPQLQNFPIFEYNQLLLLALGPYQVKQARSYYGEHIRQRGAYEVEVCPELEGIVQLGGRRPQLLRGRIRSRHYGQRVYYVYIVYESESINNNALDDILSYYCTCIAGNRTVGCCCHVMTLVWYLGWARHEQNISAPASFLDNVIIRLTE